MAPPHGGTEGADYAQRLESLETARWKQLLDVQRPYRWNLRRWNLGKTLDLGTGIGRNLTHLSPESIGVDHNPHSVAIARSRGLTALTSEEFHSSPHRTAGSFDSLLVAHVLEHLDEDAADLLLAEYVPLVRHGGLVVLICPQERGFASDATHVRFVDEAGLRVHAGRAGLEPVRGYSFPFPRPAGKVFAYNEFNLVCRVS